MTCYFVVPLTTRLVRTILFVLFFFVSFQLVRKDAEGVFPHFFSMLFHCCQFRVGALGNGSVGETANGDLVRHFEPHQALQAYKIPAAVSSLIAKKPSGRLSLSNKSGVMAMARSRLSHSLIMLSFTGIFVFLHGVQISVASVFGDFKMWIGSVKEDALASCLNHVLHSGKRSGISRLPPLAPFSARYRCGRRRRPEYCCLTIPDNDCIVPYSWQAMR